MSSIRLVRIKASNTNTLGPGDQLVHVASNDVVVIRERKAHDSGWWVDRAGGPGGGLDDLVIERGEWMLLPRNAGAS